jgi:site-specific recombinase XerD
MTDLAPLIQSYFTRRLVLEQSAGPNTIVCYRDTIKLLVTYIHQQTGKHPSRQSLTDLDAGAISAFLDHLENSRGNSITTRNTRLAVIHALFRYAALSRVDQSELIQRVLAIPFKLHDRTDLCYLTSAEITALLSAPDPGTWHGRRDHALLALSCQTGLRVSELTGLTIGDIHLGTGPHVRCHGKGRKNRAVPLTGHTRQALQAWLAERAGTPADPLFCTRAGSALSRDAVERLVAKHAVAAAQALPPMTGKHVTPHTLRHSAAMTLVAAGTSITVIALWLGHESLQSTMIYIHADMALKQQALDRTAAPGTSPGVYQPPDTLLAFLATL